MAQRFVRPRGLAGKKNDGRGARHESRGSVGEWEGGGQQEVERGNRVRFKASGVGGTPAALLTDWLGLKNSGFAALALAFAVDGGHLDLVGGLRLQAADGDLGVGCRGRRGSYSMRVNKKTKKVMHEFI